MGGVRNASDAGNASGAPNTSGTCRSADPKRFTPVERAWITYDWANSAYATIIMAAVFPIYFANVAHDAGVAGDVWWGTGSSVATLVVALMAPFVGALADFHGMKKKLFTAALMIGLIFTLLMAVTDNWIWMLVGYVISYVGYSGSLLFYDSFLTDVTTPERMDRVSAWGYAMGYIGGSTIPFLVSIALILFGERVGISAALAVKLSVLLCVIWWAVFSLPILRRVHQRHALPNPQQDRLRQALINAYRTIREIIRDRTLLLFMLAYFFYIDGVNTVIHMATVYGASLGLGSSAMILALLVTQLVAMPFSILFSKLAGKFGSLRIIHAAIVVYGVVCLVGFRMGYSIEVARGEAELARATNEATILFWLMAVLVGTCQGGIQALSRSFFGKLVPPERSSEYFGVFDIFGKFAAVLGPGLYALIVSLTGRSSFGILGLILLFAAGFIVLTLGHRRLDEAEQRASKRVIKSE